MDQTRTEGDTLRAQRVACTELTRTLTTTVLVPTVADTPQKHLP